MTRNAGLRAACLAVAASAIGLASCASNPPEPVATDTLQQVTATVAAVDQATRIVTLRGSDGTTIPVQVGPEVRNLDQVRVGDKVVASYYKGVLAEVKKPGEGARGVSTASAATRARPGERPAGAAGAAIRTTVTIESIDTSFDTVTFKTRDGTTRTYAVETDEGRQFIRGLRKGDQVEVTYIEALAIEVKPAS
jgi:hypothetical protein